MYVYIDVQSPVVQVDIDGTEGNNEHNNGNVEYGEKLVQGTWLFHTENHERCILLLLLLLCYTKRLVI